MRNCRHDPCARLPDFDTPRALTKDDITRLSDDIVISAKNAIEACLDSVEFHAANGFLTHQFLPEVLKCRNFRYTTVASRQLPNPWGRKRDQTGLAPCRWPDKA